MSDTVTRSMDADAVVESARHWGNSLATVQIRHGVTSPQENILSGEWAGDLTPRDLYAALLGDDWDGGRPRWVDANTGLPFDTDFLLTEICDAFESAYTGADWPQIENHHE